MSYHEIRVRARNLNWWLITHWYPWWLIDAWQWCEQVIYGPHNARVLAEMEYRFGCVLDHMGTGMSKAYYTLPAMYAEIDRALSEYADDALADELKAYHQPQSLGKWHEDDGPVLWWKFPIVEPPYVGTPLDEDWPGYHTHWTECPEPEQPGE